MTKKESDAARVSEEMDEMWRKFGLPGIADFDRAGYWRDAIETIKKAKAAWEGSKLMSETYSQLFEKYEKLKAEFTEIKRENDEWRECAKYDPMMEGPRFKGWDRSQMERCRKEFIEKQ